MSWVLNPGTVSGNLAIAKNGTTVGTRPNLNLIEGSQVSITAVDNAGASEVDVTIASSAGATSLSGAMPVGVISMAGDSSMLAERDLSRGGQYNTPSAWPTANLACYGSVTIPVQVTAYKMFWVNGATVSGNVDVGIYSEAGTRLVSSGSTAQSGVSVPQVVDIADTVLAPGTYYLGMAMDNTTGTVARTTAGGNLFEIRTCGCAQQASAFVLPATATLTGAPSQAFFPNIGVVFQGATF